MHSEGLIKETKLGTFYSNVFIFEFGYIFSEIEKVVNTFSESYNVIIT